jgi:hypothetical protein
MGFWGFYRQTQRNAEDVGGDLEERKARMLMAPYLQAEFDREWVTQHRAHLKAEADIMKDVPGWVVGRSVYMGNRWVNRKPLLLDVQHVSFLRSFDGQFLVDLLTDCYLIVFLSTANPQSRLSYLYNPRQYVSLSLH